jgi:hypothetical protein
MTLPAHRRQEGTILLGLTALTLEKMNAVTTSGVGRADIRATGGHGQHRDLRSSI